MYTSTLDGDRRQHTQGAADADGGAGAGGRQQRPPPPRPSLHAAFAAHGDAPPSQPFAMHASGAVLVAHGEGLVT